MGLETPQQRNLTSSGPQPLSSATLSDKNFGRLLHAAWIANLWLLLGGACWVGFFARELALNPGNRDATSDALYGTGFVGFTISGIIQAFIDLVWTRSVPFGRYSTSFLWNMVISLLFLLGVLGDFIAYMFWRQGPTGIDEERITQWVSSHLWLIASIIVLWTNMKRTEKLEDKTDAIGNLFFLCDALLNALARYTTDIHPGRGPDFRELRLELSSSIFWILNALLYLCGDLIRIKRRYEQTTEDASISGKDSTDNLQDSFQDL